MHWIWLIIVGAIVGALGRFFHPGSDPMGWILTIVIGIASLLVAGAIISGFWGLRARGRDRGHPGRDRRSLPRDARPPVVGT
jgi:uncharacterized membrane protein YeaQ/YmgE (transglycosylase-associated protein family)